MKLVVPEHAVPEHGVAAQVRSPVICYPVDGLRSADLASYRAARVGWNRVRTVLVPPRDARCFAVAAGEFFRVSSVEGPQVGDLNLWNAHGIRERFFSGKTRAAWHAPVDEGQAVVVLAPHAGHGDDYRRYARLVRVRPLMCTGFTRDTGQYFMKASPVRPADFLEVFAEMDLLGALSACPGGDCSAEHSSDQAACCPLLVEVFRPAAPPTGWVPSPANGYDRSHGR